MKRKWCGWRKETYLWNLGDGRQCQESDSWTWVFETLGGCDGGCGIDVFLSKREGRGATGNVPAERKTEIFIAFAQGQNGNSMCRLFGRWEYIWMLAIMININFGATDLLLRNWGACVDTIFWHVSRKMILVKGRWPIWKKPKDTQGWNRPMEVRPMGQENILWRCWSASSGARLIESCRWS